MISERVRERTRGWLTGVASAVAHTGVTPNLLTWLGFGLSVVAGGFLARGAFTVGAGVLILGALFDALDGSLARVTGRTSTFGAFLDSTLDRFSEAAVYLGLLIRFSGQPDGRLEVVLSYAAIVGSLMVSYTRARAEGLGIDCRVGLFTRMERLVVLILGLLVGRVRVALGIVALGSLLTALQRMWHVWRKT